jgi:PHD/YefM family antitoxin component YafN of YafNO toxin-antitoxin module
MRTLSGQEFNMPALTASEARANLYRPMDQAAESHQSIQETLHLLSVPGMLESIKEGMAEPVDACAKELDW